VAALLRRGIAGSLWLRIPLALRGHLRPTLRHALALGQRRQHRLCIAQGSRRLVAGACDFRARQPNLFYCAHRGSLGGGHIGGSLLNARAGVVVLVLHRLQLLSCCAGGLREMGDLVLGGLLAPTEIIAGPVDLIQKAAQSIEFRRHFFVALSSLVELALDSADDVLHAGGFSGLLAQL
jgi:hypothetical protein